MGLFRKQQKRNDDIIREHLAARILPPLGSSFNWQTYKWRDTTAQSLITERYLPSSVVAACVSTYLFAYPEPFFKLTLNGQEYKDPQLEKLLNEPHPDFSQSDLARYKINDLLLTGNSYLYKIYNAFGEVIQLLPFNDCNITPVGTKDEFIAYYHFFTYEGERIQIAKQDIIQWSWPAIDPQSRNKGLSPLILVVREIDSDIEATQYVMDYLSNHAMPGLLLKMLHPEMMGNAVLETDPKTNKITRAAAKKIVGYIREKFGGKGKGSTMLLQPGWDATILTPPLKDLNMGEVGSRQEARICGVLRVPPEVAGVNVGMAHSTENNLGAAEIRFTNRTLIPLWVQDADKLTKGLRPNFKNKEFKIEYDVENTATIQEQRRDRMRGIASEVREWMKAHSQGQLGERDEVIKAASMVFSISQDDANGIFGEIKKPEPEPTTEFPLHKKNGKAGVLV